MKNIISKISVMVLTIIVLTSVNEIYAASRIATLNQNNQAAVVTDYMGVVPTSSYPIDYLVIVGDTSRGTVQMVIREYSDATQLADVRILYSGTYNVGSRVGTTGMPSGTMSPLIASGGKNFIKLFLSTGSKKNNNTYYIASALVSTPVDDVMSTSLSSKSVKSRNMVDMNEYYSKLDKMSEELENNVDKWDENNIICQ